MTTMRVCHFSALTLTHFVLLLCLTTSARSSTLSYSLEEERPVGTVVVRDLLDDTRLGVRFTDPVARSGLRFELLESDGASSFRIDGRSLVTSRAIDRERNCSREVSCPFDFNLAVMVDNKPSELVPVHIELLDINDNAPRFPQQNITLTIPETPPGAAASSSTGTDLQLQLPIEVAIDNDSPVNGLVRYQLVPASGGVDAFQLKEGKDGGHGTVNHLSLVIVRPLDREKVDQYHLQIVASDSGAVKLSTTLDVHIVVTDINDNSPTFDRQNADGYWLNVSEDAAVGSVVGRISATDPDDGENGRIRYRLHRTPGKNGAAGKEFTVDPDSGDVVLSSPLDYEAKSTYRLTVIAEDCNRQQPASAMTSLVVTVLDVNDNSPVINIEPAHGDDIGTDVIGDVAGQPPTADLLTVPARLSARSTVLAYVSVSDADASGNQRVRCRLFSANETVPSFVALVPVDNTEYRLETVAAIPHDDEQLLPVDTLDVTIECVDAGLGPPRSTSRNLTVVFQETDEVEVEEQPGSVQSSVTPVVTDLCVSVAASSSELHGNESEIGSQPASRDDVISSGHVIAVVAASCGCLLLAATVAIIVLCASSLSKRSSSGKRIKRKQRKQIGSRKTSTTFAGGRIATSVTSSTTGADNMLQREETALCRDDSLPRLNDDVILTLDSEPLNYTVRRDRWLANPVGTADYERITNDVDSGFTEMTNSVTSFQGQNWIPETSFRTFQDCSNPQTRSLNTFLPPPAEFHTEPQNNSNLCTRWLQEDNFTDEQLLCYQPTNGDRWYLATSRSPATPCGGQVPASVEKFMESTADRDQRFPPVVRIGSMAHSVSTGSRKSVRFADDNDEIY